MLEDTPVVLLLGLAALAATGWGLAGASIVPDRLARAAAAGAAQGGLLATAVAWMAPRHDAFRARLPFGIALTACAGAIAAATMPFGPLAYVLAPLWLWRRRMRLPGLGIHAALCGRFTALGIGLGAMLGMHLAITASLTLGYRVGRPALAGLAPWLAYDAGANVVAAECFFRAALFDRAQRRWSFGIAAALATAACLARYFIDPLLPRSLEMVAGAAFYLGLLSVGNCWLYWRTGSVVPGLAAGLVFFGIYRLLHVVR